MPVVVHIDAPRVVPAYCFPRLRPYAHAPKRLRDRELARCARERREADRDVALATHVAQCGGTRLVGSYRGLGAFWASAFNPAYVSGCLRWGRVESASDAASYPDRTGNGHDFTQATSDNQPAFDAEGLNGRPALVFDGEDDVLVCTTSLAADLIGGDDNTCSVVLVASITSTTGTRAVLGVGNSGTNNPACLFGRHTSGAYRLIKQGDAGGSDSVEATGGTVDTDPHVIAVVSTESSIALYVDGKSIISMEANIGEMTVNRVALGALTRVATTLFCGTVIAADAFYNRAITDDERQYLERGYARRYGIALTA